MEPSSKSYSDHIFKKSEVVLYFAFVSKREKKNHNSETTKKTPKKCLFHKVKAPQIFPSSLFTVDQLFSEWNTSKFKELCFSESHFNFSHNTVAARRHLMDSTV